MQATKSALIALLVLMVGMPVLVAQEEAPQRPSFGETIQVRVVNVEVFVRDRKGNPVTELTAEDFRLLVDGREVPITNFYAESDGTPVVPERAQDVPPEGTPPPPPGPPEQRMHLVLFVDQTQIRPVNRERVFAQLRRFVRRSLRPEDAVAVVSLGGSLRIHSDFLNDPATVEKILDELQEQSGGENTFALERRQILNEVGRGQSGGGYAGNPFAQSTLARIRAYAQERFSHNEASVRTLRRLVESLSGVPGRKALIHVSDGIANRPGEDLYVAWRDVFGGGGLSTPTPGLPRTDFEADYEREIGRFDLLPAFEQVVDQANAAGVTLYALDAESDHATAIRAASVEAPPFHEAIERLETNLRAPLEFAAQATGGRRIQASPRLPEDLASIATDIGSYYSLGFEPPVGVEERPQEIEVRVRGRRLVVRHRESFAYATPDEQSADAAVAALLYGSVDNPLGIELEPGEPQRREDGAVVLPVHLLVPMRRVTLLPREEGEPWATDLMLFVTVKDKTGMPRPVQKIPFHLQIPAEAVEEIAEETAHYALPTVLRAGDQQVAVTLRDQAAGVNATARLDVTKLAPPLP